MSRAEAGLETALTTLPRLMHGRDPDRLRRFMGEDEAKVRRSRKRAVETGVEVERIPARRAVPRRAADAVPVSEREAVLAANALFYRAFELRDVDAMGESWAKVPHARCIHPGWEPLCGWEEIVGSWGQIFQNLGTVRVELFDVSVRMGGTLAWVELIEKLESVQDGQRAATAVLATNLFERQGDSRWRLVHHHASPIMVRQSSPTKSGEPIH